MTDTKGSSKDNTDGSKASESRKRKAEQISADDDGIPHLPAPVWGHVLDFMPYQEVRSALLISKHVAVEAAKYAQTFNIMKGCEMYIPAARRFLNVTEVNILCFLEGTGTFFVRDENCKVSLDVASRIMPFLASLAKIRRGFVGGIVKQKDRDTGVIGFRRTTYNPNLCFNINRNETVDILRSLLTAYVAALKTGALREIELRGVGDSLFWIDSCPHRSATCQWCRDILLHFPIHDLLEFLAYYDAADDDEEEVKDLCLTKEEAWSIALKRLDAAQAIEEMSEPLLFGLMSMRFDWSVVKAGSKAAAINQLPNKLHAAERSCEETKVWQIYFDNFEKIDFLIERGFNPKLITRKYALERWARYIGADTNNDWATDGKAFHANNFHAWKRSTVEGLAARGFPIDCDCVPVIDDEYCEL